MSRPKSSSEAGQNGWKDTGSFIRKPNGGWLHPDWMMKKGITFYVRYIGCVKILQSMRAINDEDRGIIVREAIAKCCDKGGVIPVKKRKVPKICTGIIGESYNSYCGQLIEMNISKSSITMKSQSSGTEMHCHDITNISFASGGSKDYSLMVAYVSKDAMLERACFVVECQKGVVDEVICTMGQAFELKYKEYLKTPLTVTEVPERFSQPVFTPEPRKESSSSATYAVLSNDHIPLEDYTSHYSVPRNSPPPEDRSSQGGVISDSGYSNLLHGVQRQDVSPQPGYRRLNFSESRSEPSGADVMFSAGDHYSEPDVGFGQYAAVYDNPIACLVASPEAPSEVIYDDPDDAFDIQIPNSGPKNGAQSWATFENETPKEYKDPQGYLVPSESRRAHADEEDDDVADYQPVPTREECRKPSPLARESWFHGTIKREAAEQLIHADGDFLVRESTTSKGQFVLSGMQDGQCRHLLLVDPQGKVRTKDRQFKDVPELISFHLKNNVPIISGGSSVFLKKEISKDLKDRYSFAI